MGGYSVIARVGETLIKALQHTLVPELVRFPGQVALCSPADRENTVLGIFLYDVQESESLRVHAMIDLTADRQQYPPVYLDLYYMLTVYCEGDVRFRYVQEEQILGKIVQYFHDFPVIPVGDINCKIELQRIATEDKLKLWSFPEQPFKVSLFYKVSPVPVDSGITKEVVRVRERQVNMERMQE